MLEMAGRMNRWKYSKIKISTTFLIDNSLEIFGSLIVSKLAKWFCFSTHHPLTHCPSWDPNTIPNHTGQTMQLRFWTWHGTMWQCGEGCEGVGNDRVIQNTIDRYTVCIIYFLSAYRFGIVSTYSPRGCNTKVANRRCRSNDTHGFVTALAHKSDTHKVYLRKAL